MTATQEDLFAVTEEAVQRAGQHADSQWMRDAQRCVRTLALVGQPFTTDDVWALLERTSTAVTHEPRAMGAVMRGARRQELVKVTDYRPSQRPGCHQRPIPVYVATHPST